MKRAGQEGHGQASGNRLSWLERNDEMALRAGLKRDCQALRDGAIGPHGFAQR